MVVHHFTRGVVQRSRRLTARRDYVCNVASIIRRIRLSGGGKWVNRPSSSCSSWRVAATRQIRRQICGSRRVPTGGVRAIRLGGKLNCVHVGFCLRNFGFRLCRYVVSEAGACEYAGDYDNHQQLYDCKAATATTSEILNRCVHAKTPSLDVSCVRADALLQRCDEIIQQDNWKRAGSA